MGVGAPYVCAGRGVGLLLIDRPRRPRWAVKGHALDDQRDTEDLQRRGYLGPGHDANDQDISCRMRIIPDNTYAEANDLLERSKLGV